MEIILDEISELITDTDGDPIGEIELRDAMNGFVSGLDLTKRHIFLKRYYYMMSLRDIAVDMGMSLGTVKSHLSRMRAALKKHLTERGIAI